MSDPYQILGIGRNASDEEVKKAYRDKARQYHPDKNPGNQAAEEMFKIVQEAYSQIMDERKNGGMHAGTGYAGGFYGNGSQGRTRSRNPENETRYQAAASYISNGYYQEAINVLMHLSERDAEWFYLSAVANAGLGNNYMALQQARTAVSMEPGNWTYQQYLRSLEMGTASYRSRNQTMRGGTAVDNTCLNLCACNMCLNMCCNELCCDAILCC